MVLYFFYNKITYICDNYRLSEYLLNFAKYLLISNNPECISFLKACKSFRSEKISITVNAYKEQSVTAAKLTFGNSHAYQRRAFRKLDG